MPMKNVVPVSIRCCSTGSASTRYGASGALGAWLVTFLRWRLMASRASIELKVTRILYRKSPSSTRVSCGALKPSSNDRFSTSANSRIGRRSRVSLPDETLVHVDLGLRRDLDRDDAGVGGIAEQQPVTVKLRRNFLVVFVVIAIRVSRLCTRALASDNASTRIWIQSAPRYPRPTRKIAYAAPPIISVGVPSSESRRLM